MSEQRQVCWCGRPRWGERERESQPWARERGGESGYIERRAKQDHTMEWLTRESVGGLLNMNPAVQNVVVSLVAMQRTCGVDS